MNLLSIETSTRACVVTLSAGSSSYHKIEQGVKTHSSVLLSLIDAVLKEAGLQKSQLNGIAFGAGPGSFIGVRLGASVTQGLSFALDLPVYPLCSMQVLAQSVYEQNAFKNVQLVVNAHMGDFYVGEFELIDGIMTSVTPVCAAKTAPESMRADCIKLMDDFPEITSKALHNIAMQALLNQKPLESFQALPVYLRGNSLWKEASSGHV